MSQFLWEWTESNRRSWKLSWHVAPFTCFHSLMPVFPGCHPTLSRHVGYGGRSVPGCHRFMALAAGFQKSQNTRLCSNKAAPPIVNHQMVCIVYFKSVAGRRPQTGPPDMW